MNPRGILAGPGASLSGKVTLGYYAVALVILVTSLFFVGELRNLEERVLLGQRATDLFDTVLEIRRFERNYFLHRQPSDLEENERYIRLTQKLLASHRADFLAITEAGRLDKLQSLLVEYRQQISSINLAMAEQRQLTLIESHVRALGKEVVAIAETMAGSERQQLQATLASFRTTLLGVIVGMAILIVLIGRAMSQRVVRPLKALEASVAAIPNKQRAGLEPPSQDREIVSIIKVFNHMLEELDLRQKSLMRSERLVSLGTMLSGVAHELNNPLSNISSSCQILQEEIGDGDVEMQKRYLGQIDQQTERARIIVRSLLDFSRDKGFRKDAVLLAPLVAQTVSFVRGEVSAKSVVQLDIPGDLIVSADAQRLQQVFVNLIRNAMDALGVSGRIQIAAREVQVDTPPAGTTLGSGCDYKGRAVEITVADSGPGIAPDILPRIFDPFFTTKDVGRGMGLGLFVVYEIVDEHDGCIAVQSVPGQGTSFLIRLPQTGEMANPAHVEAD